MKKCWECPYKGSIPGSAHIKCMFDWKKSKKKNARMRFKLW